MRAALIIAAHHLKRIVRNPGLVLLLMAIPITLALIEYAAFGRTVARGTLPPTRVLVLDEDGTLLSRAVPQAFSRGPAKDMVKLAEVASLDEARRQFRRNQAAALIAVPRGFQDAVLAGARAEVTVYKNPLQPIGSEIAGSIAEMTAVLGNGFYSEAAEPLQRVNALKRAGRPPASADIGAIAVALYEAGLRLEGASGLTSVAVDVRRDTAAPARSGFGASPEEFFAYVFPGLVIFALLFIAQAFALRLLRDRLRGLTRRITLTPASRSAVVWGGAIFLVAGLFALLVTLALVGALIFGIRLRDPLALVVLGVGFAVFAAGLHLLSISLARSDRSAAFAGSVAVLVLSLVGGTFIPAESYPPALRTLAVLVPNGAAQQGLIDVLVHQRDFGALGSRFAVLWGWAAVMLALALVAERRRLRT